MRAQKWQPRCLIFVDSRPEALRRRLSLGCAFEVIEDIEVWRPGLSCLCDAGQRIVIDVMECRNSIQALRTMNRLAVRGACPVEELASSFAHPSTGVVALRAPAL